MSFTGTTDKCKTCDKTVYFMDLLTVDGSTYHKSCFKCSHCKGTLATHAPSKVSSLFTGTQDKCAACEKTVYPFEKIMMEGESYHKTCFKCAHGGCPLTLDSYASLDGILYCKHHFAQLFRVKGNYNHVLEAAKVKQGAASEDHVEGTQEEKAEGASAENAEDKPEEQTENTDDQQPEDS
ncbi:hypothetical protein AgCh_016595 [Apium graveolens]